MNTHQFWEIFGEDFTSVHERVVRVNAHLKWTHADRTEFERSLITHLNLLDGERVRQAAIRVAGAPASEDIELFVRCSILNAGRETFEHWLQPGGAEDAERLDLADGDVLLELLETVDYEMTPPPGLNDAQRDLFSLGDAKSQDLIMVTLGGSELRPRIVWEAVFDIAKRRLNADIVLQTILTATKRDLVVIDLAITHHHSAGPVLGRCALGRYGATIELRGNVHDFKLSQAVSCARSFLSEGLRLAARRWQ